ncbi:MAG: hypothetical protein WC313_00755 [Candidatus Kapaibacterium sp.]
MANRCLGICAFAILLLLMQCRYAQSQCGCCAAAFSGAALAAGTSNIGVIKENTLRIIGMYRFLHGSRFYNNDSELKKFYDESLNIHYGGLNLAYGVTTRFTLETEISSYPDKDLNFGYSREKISGFSTFALIGKYTILADRDNKQEITLGLGAKLPITNNTTLSGTSGLIYQIFYFKNLNEKYNIIAAHRGEMFVENNTGFKPGNSFVSSVFVTRILGDGFTGIMELRHDYLSKSEQESELIQNSGKTVVSLVPQLTYSLDGYSVSAFIEYPFYKKYVNIQLSEQFGAGLAVIFML